MFKDWDRMTWAERDLERRREAARYTFARLATKADAEGCEHLARRLRVLGWNVGKTGQFSSSTPPGFAKVATARFDRLVKQAKADPSKSFYLDGLALPLRRSRQQIRDAKKALEAAEKQRAKDARAAAAAARRRPAVAVATVRPQPAPTARTAGQLALF